jgi:hypothetical protein
LVLFWCEKFKSTTWPNRKVENNYSNLNCIESLKINGSKSSGWWAHIVFLSKFFIISSVKSILNIDWLKISTISSWLNNNLIKCSWCSYFISNPFSNLWIFSLPSTIWFAWNI